MGLFEKLGLRRPKEVWPKEIWHTHKVGFGEVFTAVESELSKVSDDRLRTPFESAVRKETMSVEDLWRWGSQLIEIHGAHDEDGTLVLSTSSLTSEVTDWPDEVYGTMTPEKEDTVEAIGMANTRKFTRIRYIPQQYFIHNHPLQPNKDGEKKVDIPQLSHGDIFVSAISKSECDVILTPTSVTSYKNRDKDLIDKHTYEMRI